MGTGGKAELGLISFKVPLPVTKTKTEGRRKEPQRRACNIPGGGRSPEEGLQHPGKRMRGVCQKLRMGVCFGTRANRIADGLYVWEEGESIQSRSSQVVACSTWVHRGS